jgi:hypothetical protein
MMPVFVAPPSLAGLFPGTLRQKGTAEAGATPKGGAASTLPHQIMMDCR